MAKTILVTGCNGFIGTNFTNLIYKKYPDLEIVNLDILDFEISKTNHQDKDSSRYHFVHGSILDKDLLNKLFSQYQFDQVINFAANSHVDNSIVNPEAFTFNNVLGTQRLLDTALNFETPRFIHISTDEVYGSIGFDEASTKEDSPIKPNNPYSASKAGADCLVRSYHVTYKMPVIITRSSNNFGPYQYPEKLIPVVISNAINNEAIPIYGKGANVRDWIFVEDNCAALDIVRNKGTIGEVYNIPGSEEITNLELTKRILKVLGKDESLIRFVEDRKGHDLRYSMDGTKIAKLGFKHQFSFEDALSQTINWYKANPKWLKVKVAK